MNEQIKDRLLNRCREMEIPLIGVADVARWVDPPFSPWMPSEFFPQAIFPEAQSVIVIGLPIPLPVLETSPSIWYRELYTTVNILLDQFTYRLAGFLTREGYPSVPVPRDGYGSIGVLLKNPVAFFSQRHAAFLAGLGNFGINNMILTPEFGPRVRFGSVLTAASLPPDPLRVDPFCIRCMRCVHLCPSFALAKEDYPAGTTDKYACASWSDQLHKRYISPCGICIKVCPVGNDREQFSRKDASIYAEPESSPVLQQAWDHVRKYGGK